MTGVCVITETSASPPKVSAGAASDYSTWNVQQLMKMYYGMAARICTAFCVIMTTSRFGTGRLFPHQDMFKWLVYGNGTSSFMP